MGLTLSGWQVIFGCFCQLYNSAESFVLRMFSLQTLYYILGENIALGQPATQSDTLWDFGPGQALNIHRTHKFSSCHCGTLIHQFRQLHWSDQSGFGFIENCYSDSFIFSGMKYESFLHMMMTGIPDVKTFLTKFSNIFKPCWQFWNMPVSVAVPSLVSLITIQTFSLANIIFDLLTIKQVTIKIYITKILNIAMASAGPCFILYKALYPETEVWHF